MIKFQRTLPYIAVVFCGGVDERLTVSVREGKKQELA